MRSFSPKVSAVDVHVLDVSRLGVALEPELSRTVWLLRRKGRQARAARACRDHLTDWSATLSPRPA